MKRLAFLVLPLAVLLAAGAAAGWSLLGPTTLAVASDPDGAIVRVDGIEVGRTPLAGTRIWPPRAVRVELEREGHRPLVRHVAADPGGSVLLSVSLESTGDRSPILAPGQGKAHLAIESDPPGATVVLDGRALAVETPAKDLEFEPGFYSIGLELEGYAPYGPRGIRLDAGAQERLAVALVPVVGALTVESEPPGAVIVLDGREIGETPIARRLLPEGGYSLRLVKEGYRTHEEPGLVVAGGKERTIRVRLERQTGRVRLVSEPSGLRVRLVHVEERLEREVATPFAGELSTGRWRYVVEDPRRLRFAPLAGELEASAGGDVEARFHPLPLLEERWERGLAVPLAASPVLTDLDADGRLEVVLADLGGGLTVLSAAGEVLARIEVAAGPISAPAAADVDGDGYLDLVVSTSTGELAAVSGRTGRVVRTAGGGGPSADPATPVLADLDGDGAPDALAVHAGAVAAYSFRREDALWAAGEARAVRAVRLSDLDGDGAPEVAISTGGGSIQVVSGRTGAPLSSLTLPGKGPAWALEVPGASPPLAIAGRVGGGTRAFDPKTGATRWTSEREAILPGAASFAAGRLVLACGALGLVALDPTSGEVVWSHALPSGPQYPFTLAPVAADADGDGVTDVLASSGPAGTIHAISGSGEDRLWALEERQGLAGAPAAGDLDGDGRLEVVLASRFGWVYARSIEPLGGRRVLPGASRAMGGAVALDGAAVHGTADGRIVCRRPDPGVVWSATIGAEVFAAPVLAGDGVYAGDFEGGLHRLGRDGTREWSVRLPEPIYGLAALPDVDGDGTPDVLAATGGDEGFVTARRGGSGEEIWSWRLREPIRAAPLVAGDVVYVAGARGRVVALSAAAPGERARWDVELGEPVQAPPALAGGRLAVATALGRVVLLSLDRGEVEGLDERLAGAVLGRPLESGPLLVVGCADGSLSAWTLEDGRLAWRVDLGGPVVAAPLAAPGGRVVAATRRGRLHVLDAADGRILRNHPVGPEVVAQPLLAGDAVLVLATDGALHRIPLPPETPEEPVATDPRLDPFAATSWADLERALAPDPAPIERVLLAATWLDLRPGTAVDVPVLGAYFSGDFARAAEEASARLEADRTDPDRLIALALCRAAQGKKAEALALARAASPPTPRTRDRFAAWVESLSR